MKQMKLLPFIGPFVACFTITAAAQVHTLPGISLLVRNYKYLRAVDNKEVTQPVVLLEHKASLYGHWGNIESHTPFQN